MAARLGSLVVLAASLAQTGAEESKPIVIVDHITSSVYLDDRRRGRGKVGQPLRAKPPVPLVVGLTGSAIACGAICDFVVKQRRLSWQDAPAEEVWEVPVDTEDSGQKGSTAVTRVKVSIAMLVGLIVTTAVRRAAQKRPVRGVADAVAAPERKEANDLGCIIKSKKKVSVANRDIKLPEDTQEIQFAGTDEPHPELEPGRAGESDAELGNLKTDDESEDDLSTGLQPGNKGYVYKRKSEYEAKESRTNSSGDLLVLQRKETERSKRKPEHHRISTEHRLADLVGLVEAVHDDDDSRGFRRPPEFHRMHTEPQTPNEEEKEEREESVDSFVEFERRNNNANKEVNRDVGFYRIHTPQVDSKTSFYRISTESAEG